MQKTGRLLSNKYGQTDTGAAELKKYSYVIPAVDSAEPMTILCAQRRYNPKINVDALSAISVLPSEM